MAIFLETKRLLIKTPKIADFENLYALQTDVDVMKYVGNGIRTAAEVTLGLEKAIAHQDKHHFSLGCVYEKASGNFVGRAGLIHLAYDDQQPDIEVGYALTKSAWNNGYATELTKALIDWGFQNIPIAKLVGVINPENDKSRRVLEKAGMSFIGRSQYCDKEVALYAINKINHQ